MKILVFACDLVFSGTVVNAIDLAAALRDIYGHDVVLFAAPGPLISVVEDKCLRFVPAPPAQPPIHPSPVRMRALRDVIRRERPDLVHVWDWAQCLDAYYIEHLMMAVPIVVTDMCMSLQRLLPKALPTTFGTPEIVDRARAAGRRRLELILPPVDVQANAPDAVSPDAFRTRLGITDGEIVLVTVSRLDACMKAESLYRSIDALGALSDDPPLRLVIVGDGDARGELERLANETNEKRGRAVVTLTGALVDPRPAYAAADVVIGMGGSALRGMAFGKPVVIVGARGFSAPFAPETSEYFYYRGLYGVGDGTASNARLAADIQTLADHPERRRALGTFSRQFVLKHFALEVVSARLADFCERAAANQRRFGVALADGIRTAAVWVRERRFVPPPPTRHSRTGQL